MELILWRHAEAEDPAPGQDDLQRALTARGEQQAARMAQWLDCRLPERVLILCSPALRCEQTVAVLGRKYESRAALAPGSDAQQLLREAGWPGSKQPVLLVGHQPTLGQAVSSLLGLADADSPFRKGAVWWLRGRERAGRHQAVVVTVQSPELL